MKKLPFDSRDLPGSPEELLMLIVQHEPVFCPQSTRVTEYRDKPENPDHVDLIYHFTANPCPHCVDSNEPLREATAEPTSSKVDCVSGAKEVRAELDHELVTTGDDGLTLYERLSEYAANVAKHLRNEDQHSLLHRVIDDAFSRICREAFRPSKSWEAYLADKLGFKRADIYGGRDNEHRNFLQETDPWTIVSRSRQAAPTNPANDSELFERRERQYLALRKALTQAVNGWVTTGEPGSTERSESLLKKRVLEILLRETSNTVRVPLALIARRLDLPDPDVRRASKEGFLDFYRIMRDDDDLTDTEFESVFPK